MTALENTGLCPLKAGEQLHLESRACSISRWVHYKEETYNGSYTILFARSQLWNVHILTFLQPSLPHRWQRPFRYASMPANQSAYRRRVPKQIEMTPLSVEAQEGRRFRSNNIQSRKLWTESPSLVDYGASLSGEAKHSVRDFEMLCVDRVKVFASTQCGGPPPYHSSNIRATYTTFQRHHFTSCFDQTTWIYPMTMALESIVGL